jgi:hypothetical protein
MDQITSLRLYLLLNKSSRSSKLEELMKLLRQGKKKKEGNFSKKKKDRNASHG